MAQNDEQLIEEPVDARVITSYVKYYMEHSSNAKFYNNRRLII